MNIDMFWEDGISRSVADDLKNCALSCLNVAVYIFVLIGWLCYGMFYLMAWTYKVIDKEMKLRDKSKPDYKSKKTRAKKDIYNDMEKW